MYLEKYMRRLHDSLTATSHDCPRTQYFLSAPNYSVYSKKFLLVQRSLIFELCLRAVLCVHLIGVSVRNKFYIRTEEGASHISQYEGQLHYQDQARGCEFGLPTSAFKKPDVAPCSRNTTTGEAELLGASWPASLTIQQWFPMQCDHISKK